MENMCCHNRFCLKTFNWSFKKKKCHSTGFPVTRIIKIRLLVTVKQLNNFKDGNFLRKNAFPQWNNVKRPKSFFFFSFLQASPCQVSDTSSYFLYFHCISFNFFHSVSWKWIFDLFPLNLSPMGLWSWETLHCICDTAGYTGEKDQTPPPTQNIKR